MSRSLTPDEGEIRAIGPAHPVAGRSWYGADVGVAAVAVVALVEHLRCRANYATMPLLALIAPGALALGSAAYRGHIRQGIRQLWGQVEAAAGGRGPIPWLAAGMLVALPTWLLYLSNQRTFGAVDTQPVVPTAVSLITQRDAELGEYLAPGSASCLINARGKVGACIREVAGGVYSSYPAGMVPFAVVTAGLAGVLDADLRDEQVQLRLQKVTAAALGAACVALWFLVALTLAPPRVAWLVAGCLAAGSNLFATVGMATWQHGGVIFWSLVALLVEFRSAGRPGWRGAVIQGVCCALMASCRLTSITLLIPFGAWVLVRDPRRAALIVATAALAFLPWAGFYRATYGTPFGPSMSFAEGRLWSAEVFTPLLGVLVSPSRGLLVYQPWIALGLLAALPRFRAARPGPPGWAAFCLAAIGCHLLLISTWGCWWGGWCWGSRLVVEIVPLAALLAVGPVAALAGSRRGRAVVVVLGLVGVAMQASGVFLHPIRWNEKAQFPAALWSWRDAPFLDFSTRDRRTPLDRAAP